MKRFALLILALSVSACASYAPNQQIAPSEPSPDKATVQFAEFIMHNDERTKATLLKMQKQFNYMDVKKIGQDYKLSAYAFSDLEKKNLNDIFRHDYVELISFEDRDSEEFVRNPIVFSIPQSAESSAALADFRSGHISDILKKAAESFFLSSDFTGYCPADGKLEFAEKGFLIFGPFTPKRTPLGKTVIAVENITDSTADLVIAWLYDLKRAKSTEPFETVEENSLINSRRAIHIKISARRLNYDEQNWTIELSGQGFHDYAPYEKKGRCNTKSEHNERQPFFPTSIIMREYVSAIYSRFNATFPTQSGDSDLVSGGAGEQVSMN